MARVDPERALVASVLDRLMDDQPDVKSEPAQHRTQRLRELRAAVRRDLERLLNTRHRCLAWPEELEQVSESVVDYGIPDLGGLQLGSAAAQERFRQSVEQVLRRFEPRFKRVKVVSLVDPDGVDRTLRFRIEALLHAQPSPIAVAFDSTVEPVTEAFQVKE